MLAGQCRQRRPLHLIQHDRDRSSLRHSASLRSVGAECNIFVDQDTGDVLQLERPKWLEGDAETTVHMIAYRS
jgi:hypothetical protein